jgi:cob(I)alamin adenosyltransferase
MEDLSGLYSCTLDDGAVAVGETILKWPDPRIEVIGAIEEAFSLLALAATTPGLPSTLSEPVSAVCDDLFDIVADLADPLPAWGRPARPRIDSTWLEPLHNWCEELSADLPQVEGYVMPTGTPGARWLHLVRSAVRRAERAARLAETSCHVNPCVIAYLTKLSDLLFIMARQANLRADQPERTWRPTPHRP